jgi:hypothetical protein
MFAASRKKQEEQSPVSRLACGSALPLSLARADAKRKDFPDVKKQTGQRIFLLSPAYAGGRRAQMLLSEHAQFALAKKLRTETGATISEVFTFLSGLYFRGKIAYANTFARTKNGSCGVFVITPTRGLVDARSTITLSDLREFAAVAIDEADPRYRKPLERSVRRLARELPNGSEVILLGSIATRKYVDVFLKYFKDRLCFPAEFVGRGDMSRGGLMLRRAADHVELDYVSVQGAVLHGARPPKLEPRRYPKNSPI